MTTQWLILVGVYALFLCAVLVFGIGMNRRRPLWARPLAERFKQASRGKKALVIATVAAAFYLVIGAFEWLGASLGIPDFRVYRNPIILALMIPFGALVVGFGSLLFVRSPDDEPHDWLTDMRKENGR